MLRGICKVATVVFLGLTMSSQDTFAEVALARDGVATCTIVLPDDSIDFEKLAAREMADHLEQVTGARPAIASAPGTGTNVYVGRSALIEQLLGDVDFDALGTDGIVMRTVEDDLVLSGGRPGGVLFAVYTFLQDVVGVRWWATDATHLPQKPTLIVSDLNVVYRPPFDLRHFRTGGLADKAFTLRLRHNGNVVGWDTGQHTIHKLVPAEEHFEAHPDWFMYRADDGLGSDRYSFENGLKYIKETRPESWLPIAQTKRRLPWQICASSVGTRQAATKAVLEQLAVEYEQLQYPPKVIWVSQTDGRWECLCDQCAATKKREGSASAAWIEFVNHVAERVEQDYPDVLIATMAFAHTEKPTKHIRPRDNVLVYSIPVGHNRKLAIDQSGSAEDVIGWCAISKQVYIWEHDTNFRNWVGPHPNHFVLSRSLRFYANQGVKGMMIQGGYGNASEFQRLRAYLICQLMWNPNQDARPLMQEFLIGYYGDAGPFLMKWIDRQHQAIHRDPKIHLGSYDTSTDHWLTLEDLSAGTRLFGQALEAVDGDKTLEHRVRRARLSIDIVWLERYDELRAAADEVGVPFLGPADPHAALEELARNEFEVGTYEEWADFGDYIKKLQELHEH